MKPQALFVLGCSLVVLCTTFPDATAQGTGKVQEFFKKYFGEYFPKTTRSYTLYGNGLNGPADFNAGLPVGNDHQGPINSIIIRRGGSPGRGNAQQQQQQQGAASSAPAMENAWQPVQNFDPVAFAKGSHRGRSDLADEQDDTDSRIITAEDVVDAGDDTREFRMESSMSFAPPSVPGTVY